MAKLLQSSVASEAHATHSVTVSELVLVAAVYLLSFAVVAGYPHPVSGFPLDDSWIHQVVARNLARDGTLGFVPHVRSSGSSSLLWTLLLAIKWKLLPALDPVLYNEAISAVLLPLTGCALFAMARRDGLPEAACWIWALTPALDGNFLWLGTIGMEHLLFVTVSVGAVYLWFRAGWRSAAGCACCLGALSLTRPEGLALAVLAVIAARWAHRSRNAVWIVGGGVTLCVLASLTANYITSRSWLPTTYAGRKWLYFGSDQVPFRFHVLFPIDLVRSLLQPWAVLQTRPLYLLNLLIAGLMALGVWVIVSARWRRCGLLLLWSLVHIAIYLVMLPTRSHGGRYQPLFLALSFPLLFLGARAVLQKLAPRSQLVNGTLLIACLFCGAFSLRAWRSVTGAGTALIESTHAPMGRYLWQNLPPPSRVAAFDIGRMGYLYGGTLRDMGGLTDAAFLPYLRQHRAFDYLRERKVEYLVWPTSPDGTPDVQQVVPFTADTLRGMTVVTSICAPRDLWWSSFSVTLAAAQCQTLFRLIPPHQNASSNGP